MNCVNNANIQWYRQIKSSWNISLFQLPYLALKYTLVGTPSEFISDTETLPPYSGPVLADFRPNDLRKHLLLVVSHR